jgi:hypothetical protein
MTENSTSSLAAILHQECCRVTATLDEVEACAAGVAGLARRILDSDASDEAKQLAGVILARVRHVLRCVYPETRKQLNAIESIAMRAEGEIQMD